MVFLLVFHQLGLQVFRLITPIYLNKELLIVKEVCGVCRVAVSFAVISGHDILVRCAWNHTGILAVVRVCAHVLDTLIGSVIGFAVNDVTCNILVFGWRPE